MATDVLDCSESNQFGLKDMLSSLSSRPDMGKLARRPNSLRQVYPAHG
ncbi:hypothetical protein AVEN_149322-1, partial [Araneus ventricosus]